MKKKVLSILLALVAIATTAGAQGNSVNGHEYVDLGLKSGLLWATCNVGADKPEEYGYYFAWGETKGYTNDTDDSRSFNWEDYKWCDGSNTTLTKYCNNSDFGKDGFTDELIILLPDDDAATANWGEGWRMPTKADIDELLAQTTDEWTTVNGVKGHKFTAKNGSGNFIFFPSAGYKYSISSKLYYDGRSGIYWSSSLYGSDPVQAYYLVFNTDTDQDRYNVNCHRGYRNWGVSVRPVIGKDDIPTGIGAPLNDNGKMINDSWYTIDGVKLNGEPMKKGVYIIKDKKVVK